MQQFFRRRFVAAVGKHIAVGILDLLVGGSAGKGPSMVEGGSVGSALGAAQGFWFGSTPGSRLSAPSAPAGGGSGLPAAVSSSGDALGLLASVGATAGAAVLGVVGKAIAGKLK